MINGKMLKPKPKYFNKFFILKSATSSCWVKYIFATIAAINIIDVSVLKMSCPLIKLAIAITIQIRLNDKILFLSFNSENLIITKTAIQFKKNSSDITNWSKLNWIYKAPTAKKPTNKLFNLNLYLNKIKLITNSNIQNNLLKKINSLERLKTDKAKQTKVNIGMFKILIFNIS